MLKQDINVNYLHTRELPILEGMKIMSTAQAAQALGVGQQRVREFIRDGLLPAQRLGREWLIKESDLKRVRNRRKPGRPLKKTK